MKKRFQSQEELYEWDINACERLWGNLQSNRNSTNYHKRDNIPKALVVCLYLKNVIEKGMILNEEKVKRSDMSEIVELQMHVREFVLIAESE